MASEQNSTVFLSRSFTPWHCISSQPLTLYTTPTFSVEAFKEIADSLCVAQRSCDLVEERVILFLKMAAGCDFTEELVKRVKTNIRLQLSARHMPAFILETKDIPVSTK